MNPEERQNAIAIKMFVWVWALVIIVQTAAMFSLSKNETGIKVFRTLEDAFYTFPDGCQYTVDRATWMTYKTCPDGSYWVGETQVQ